MEVNQLNEKLTYIFHENIFQEYMFQTDENGTIKSPKVQRTTHLMKERLTLKKKIDEFTEKNKQVKRT